MAPIAIPLMIASAAVSAGSSILGGMHAGSASKAKQKHYRHQANTERALAQREAIRRTREGELRESRVLTRLAASGGGGPETAGGAHLLEGLNRDTRLNAGMALWEGESRASDLDYQAKLARAEERQRKRMQALSLAGNALDAGASFAGKYR
jgi:hypothetical protein